MQIGDYTLANEEKVERAINGTVGAQGQLVGGVGQDADDSEILAEYDRLGGLILKDGKYKVKTGSFYDVKAKAAFKKPKPMLLFNVNGETIEFDADKALPIEVQAAEMANDKRKARAKAKADKTAAKSSGKKAAKKAKAKSKAKEDADDEDGDDDEDSEDASDLA